MDWSPGSDFSEDGDSQHYPHLFSGYCHGRAGVSPEEQKTQDDFRWDFLPLPLVLPPTVAGFFLLYIFGIRRPFGRFLVEYFSVKIAFSWGGHRSGGGPHLFPSHVPGRREELLSR